MAALHSVSQLFRVKAAACSARSLAPRSDACTFQSRSIVPIGFRSRRRSSERVYASSGSSEADDIPISTPDETVDIVDVGVSDEEVPLELYDEIYSQVPTSPSISAAAGNDSSSEVHDLKHALVDSLYGTERGFRASSETRAEVAELIAQLEALNPTAAPTDAFDTLNGKWVLVYTSFSELFPLLAAGSLPFVEVGDIIQEIDTFSGTVKNEITFIGPVSQTTFGASATFEARSPKRIQITFQESTLSAPQITADSISLNLPRFVQLLGQRFELPSNALKPLQDAAINLAKTLSGQPPLTLPINNAKAQGWLLTTYLDSDLRVSRGDGGGLFVLVKEGSPLLNV